MLEQKDISILQNMFISVVDERLEKTEVSIMEKADGQIVKSENHVLDEIERTCGILEKQISIIQSNLDKLGRYSRITKIDNSNTALLLKLIENLEERVEKLEKKTT